LPILTSGEVARLTPFVPGRTLRFLRVFVATVEEEVVAPMLRQPTFVEAVEVMERNLGMVFTVRRPAISMLFANARKNSTLMDKLRSGIDLVCEEVHRTNPGLLAGEVGDRLENVLLTLQRTNGALLPLAERVDASGVDGLHYLAELERIATQVDLLVMTKITAAQAHGVVPWFSELVGGLDANVRAHARLGNQILFDPGHVWRQSASPEAPLAPDEREAAVDALVARFESRDPGAVRAFLLERAEVFELLQATQPALDRHFSGARCLLAIVPGEHWNDRHLALRVIVPDDAELAAQRDAFEDVWWSDNAHRAFGGLVIAVRPS